MNLYINGTGIISPAGASDTDNFLTEPLSYFTNRLTAQEPEYTNLIPPMQLRRMSRVVRMGIAAADIAVKQSGIEMPDAICVGTAMGCLQDTEAFLSKMVDQDEKMLTPTAFIQSTHNTVAGQIAMMFKCHGHNITFSQRGHSFEHALIKARLYLMTRPDAKVLVGGIDELIDTSFELMQRASVYRNVPAHPAYVSEGYALGSIAGEGAAFFVVSNYPVSEHRLRLRHLHTFTTRDLEVANNEVKNFLSTTHTNPQEIDCVIMGTNGDERDSTFYDLLETTYFKDTPCGVFKNYSGEYGTASAVALGLCMEIVRTGIFPEQMFPKGKPQRMNRICIINNFVDHFSCWILSK